MLNQRLNQGGLTWEKIVEALENITVYRKGEATNIRANYCPSVLPPPEKPGVRKRPLDGPIAGPSKVSLYYVLYYIYVSTSI